MWQSDITCREVLVLEHAGQQHPIFHMQTTALANARLALTTAKPVKTPPTAPAASPITIYTQLITPAK